MAPSPTDADANVLAAESVDARPLPAEEFVQTFKKTLQPPLVLSTPRLRVTRARTDEEIIPKRSARLAAKRMHREPRPEAQSCKVMMKRLDVARWRPSGQMRPLSKTLGNP